MTLQTVEIECHCPLCEIYFKTEIPQQLFPQLKKDGPHDTYNAACKKCFEKMLKLPRFEVKE